MDKHTPGRWAFLEDGTIRATSDFAIRTSTQMADYRGAIVASIERGIGHEYRGDSTAREHAYPEAEANALLLAAAPVMLEALREARALLAIAPEARADEGTAFDRIEAAIRAATGETVEAVNG